MNFTGNKVFLNRNNLESNLKLWIQIFGLLHRSLVALASLEELRQTLLQGVIGRNLAE
jgi:hypothetical protein